MSDDDDSFDDDFDLDDDAGDDTDEDTDDLADDLADDLDDEVDDEVEGEEPGEDLDDVRFGSAAGINEDTGNTVSWSNSYQGYYDDKTWAEVTPK